MWEADANEISVELGSALSGTLVGGVKNTMVRSVD